MPSSIVLADRQLGENRIQRSYERFETWFGLLEICMAQLGSTAPILPLTELLEARRLFTAVAFAEISNLSAPSDVTGVSRSGNFVRLAFTDNSTDETQFIIERAPVRSDGTVGAFIQFGVSPPSELGVAGDRMFFIVRPNATGNYEYRVRAADAAGVSDPSNVVRLTGFVGPALPGTIEYAYNNPDFSGDPAVTGSYPSAERNYGTGSPDQRINPDAFSLAFDGYYLAEFSERYTFHTASADGIALRVIDPRDNRVLIEFDNLSAVRDMPATGYQDVAGAADLERGVRYLVQVRYREVAGNAGFRVGWSSFSTPLESLPAELFGPIAPGGPKVTAVFVGGTEWSDGFNNKLQSTGVGLATLGYRETLGGSARDPLPWTNLDRISISFDRDVRVQSGALTVRGASGGTYSFAGFSQTGRAATWVLDHPVGADRLRLDLSAAGVTGTNDGGQTLDGEWPLPAKNTSGDGHAGGNFTYQVGVLLGDVDESGSVNAIDLGQVRARQLTSSTTGGSYSVFHDLNGDGQINAVDLGLVRARQLTRLPDGEPASPPAPAAFGPASATKDLFSSGPVLF